MGGEGQRADSWRAARFLAVGIAAAAVILALPVGGEGAAAELTPAARNLGAIFALCVVLWATEAIPVAVTALLAVVLQPLLGVAPLDGALGAFMSKVFFFVVAMFVIAGVVVHTRLDRRFALALLSRAGTDPRRVLLALMAGTAAVSSIMSDVPACAVFMAVGMGVLSRAGVKPGNSRFGKAVMMGIPIAALIGGVATPAGSSVNVIGLDLLHRFSAEHDLGIRVTFVQWMALGVPMVLVLVPAAWWAMLRFHPPEVDSVGDTGDVAAERRKLGPIGPGERKVIVILAVMVVLWVAGSWVKALDLTIVALCGAIVCFLPGISLMDWTRAERFIGWNTLFMIGGVTSLGAASMDSGLADWLVSITMGGVESWPLVAVIVLISTVTVLIHLPLPIAPVVNVVLIPPVAALSLKLGVNPAVCVLPVAFTASCAFLLPLDAVPLLTYRTGYYRMFDMLGPGGTVSALWVVVMTALMLLIAPLVGLF